MHLYIMHQQLFNSEFIINKNNCLVNFEFVVQLVNFGMEYIRQVIAYKRHFLDFYEPQPGNIQKKIEWTLNLIRIFKQVPEKYLKHVEDTNGLYEIRVEAGKHCFRIFSFFDKGDILILVNAFQKKDQKTPRKEIIKALRIMEDYYNEKDRK